MPIDLNLIPRSILDAQIRRRHMRIWATSLAPALGLLAVFAGLNWVRQSRAADAAETAEMLAAELQQARAEVRGLTAAVSETSLQLERAGALRSKRSWSGLMGLLAQVRPDDVWFVGLATDPAAPAATRGVSTPQSPQAGKPVEVRPVMIDAPRKLRISGYSVSPTGPVALVSNLKKENVFARVILERSLRDADEQSPRFHFDVLVEW